MTQATVPSPTTRWALRAVRVMAPEGTFTPPVDVVVDGATIESVAPGSGAGLPGWDGRGSYLLPGLVDCHAHLGCFTPDAEEMLGMSITRWTLEVARSAHTLLDLGITLVRDPATADSGIREGIASGAVPGPTLRVSGPALSQTGGHADGWVPSLGVEAMSGYLVPEHPGRGEWLVDGPEQMRLVVRRLLRSRVDWIKLCTTGGLLSSESDHPHQAEFTDEEIEMAVAEATRAGIPVCAHAYGGPGLTSAVRAGVTSIEHGMFLEPEQAELMAEKQCWLVPTLAVCEELQDLADAGEIPPAAVAKVREVRGLSGRQVEIARAAGVPIAVGSDLVRQGRNLRELTLLGEAGMPAGEVLVAATRGGAELLGLGDTHGRLAAGYVFDAVLIDDDPRDLAVFSRERPVSAVFQGGRIVRPHPSWVPSVGHADSMTGVVSA